TLVRAGSRTPRYLALVTSWQGQGFHAAPVRYLAGNDGALAATAGAIARIVTSAGYQGAVIDFESLDTADRSALLKVTGTIADSLHHNGASLVAIAVPAADTVTYS